MFAKELIWFGLGQQIICKVNLVKFLQDLEKSLMQKENKNLAKLTLIS